MRKLFPSTIVGLELLWSYSALVAISEWGWVGWPIPPISLIGACALAASALAPSMLPENGSWSTERLRPYILPVQVLVLILVVRFELSAGYSMVDLDWFSYVAGDISFVLGACGYGFFLIWRGVSVTSELPSMDSLHRRFLLGLIAILMALILTMFTDEHGDSRSPLVSLGAYGVAFFGTGMIAMALANLQSIRRGIERRSGDPAPTLRQWMVFPLTAVIGMISIALIVSAIFSFDIASFLLTPITFIVKAVAVIFLYGIIWPLSFVAGGLIWLLRKLGGQVEPGPEEDGGGLQLTEDPAFPEENPGYMLSDSIVLAIQWSVGIIAAIVAILILYKALSKFRKTDKEDDQEGTSESLGVWGGIKDDVRTLLVAISRWIRRHRKDAAQPPTVPASVVMASEDSREFTIKEIYQGLLWEGRATGRPRRNAETPYEYQIRIEALDTTQERALSAITHAYVASRYGGQQPDAADLQLLNRMWRGLKRIILEAGTREPRQ